MCSCTYISANKAIQQLGTHTTNICFLEPILQLTDWNAGKIVENEVNRKPENILWGVVGVAASVALKPFAKKVVAFLCCLLTLSLKAKTKHETDTEWEASMDTSALVPMYLEQKLSMSCPISGERCDVQEWEFRCESWEERRHSTGLIDLKTSLWKGHSALVAASALMPTTEQCHNNAATGKAQVKWWCFHHGPWRRCEVLFPCE